MKREGVSGTMLTDIPFRLLSTYLIYIIMGVKLSLHEGNEHQNRESPCSSHPT